MPVVVLNSILIRIAVLALAQPEIVHSSQGARSTGLLDLAYSALLSFSTYAHNDRLSWQPHRFALGFGKTGAFLLYLANRCLAGRRGAPQISSNVSVPRSFPPRLLADEPCLQLPCHRQCREIATRGDIKRTNPRVPN